MEDGRARRSSLKGLMSLSARLAEREVVMCAGSCCPSCAQASKHLEGDVGVRGASWLPGLRLVSVTGALV